MRGVILLVEDDASLASSLTKGLSEAGFEIHGATTVAAGRQILRQHACDLVLLDLGLPDADGDELLCELRAHADETPVIILTARGELTDRVDGLRHGADDYLVKPFAFSELQARIEAVMRRARRDDTILSDGALSVRRLERDVLLNDIRLELTQREIDILAYLMAHRERVIAKEELMTEVWKIRSRATPMDNVIEVSISRLRTKLKEAFGRPFLETHRGMGYQYRS